MKRALLLLALLLPVTATAETATTLKPASSPMVIPPCMTC